MREIKFRAYENEMNLMIYQGDTEYDFVLERKGIRLYDLCLDYYVKDRYVKFMQYTGCKDKNGKKIYEGDIVQQLYDDFNPTIGEIVFKDGAFRVKESNWEPEYLIIDFSELEVIGNIYENKELLEEN